MKQKKREKSEKNVDSASNCQNTLTEATMNYFCQLIRNVFHSFSFKVDGVKILERIFGDILCDIDFQRWLVERFWLKDRDELVSFLESFI